MELLKFVFSSPWVFTGVCVLIGITASGIAQIIDAWHGPRGGGEDGVVEREEE